MAIDSLLDLQHRVVAFRDQRDWAKFHTLKNLIVSLNIEAAELLELVQWKDEPSLGMDPGDAALQEHISEEVADVLIYLVLIADKVGIDLLEAACEKINQNDKKYPVHKAYGSSKKYDEL